MRVQYLVCGVFSSYFCSTFTMAFSQHIINQGDAIACSQPCLTNGSFTVMTITRHYQPIARHVSFELSFGRILIYYMLLQEKPRNDTPLSVYFLGPFYHLHPSTDSSLYSPPPSSSPSFQLSYVLHHQPYVPSSPPRCPLSTQS